MAGKSSKLRVPSKYGIYEAEGLVQVAAVVMIEIVRRPVAFGVGIMFLGAILGVKSPVLPLIASILGN